jgi:predicted GTPase
MKKLGKKVCVVRHPMPYGDLAKQAVQRFETYEDLKKHNVTIEEREEYEQHIDTNTVVYAGVDYEAILREVEKECDIVLWDGGNNDTPFFRPDLWITIVDPHRPNHELTYYPGDSNFRASDVLVINKVNTADPKNVQIIKDNIAKFNPKAKVFETNSVVVLDKPELVKGKKVVLVEDGPTLTHGEMKYGAGKVAADRYEVAEIIDPKPYAVGSILATYKKYPHVGDLIPAMGYFPEQIADLEKTINTVPCEAVIIATPMDLRGLINVEKPSAVAKYHSEDADPNNTLEALLTEFINKL